VSSVLGHWLESHFDDRPFVVDWYNVPANTFMGLESMDDIYNEKKWVWYALLLCGFFVVAYVGVAANITLSRPLDEWPAYYFIWLFCLSADGIAVILL
jgi:hypothetical protein